MRSVRAAKRGEDEEAEDRERDIERITQMQTRGACQLRERNILLPFVGGGRGGTCFEKQRERRDV